MGLFVCSTYSMQPDEPRQRRPGQAILVIFKLDSCLIRASGCHGAAIVVTDSLYVTPALRGVYELRLPKRLFNKKEGAKPTLIFTKPITALQKSPTWSKAVVFVASPLTSTPGSTWTS